MEMERVPKQRARSEKTEKVLHESLTSHISPQEGVDSSF